MKGKKYYYGSPIKVVSAKLYYVDSLQYGLFCVTAESHLFVSWSVRLINAKLHTKMDKTGIAVTKLV